MLLVSNFTAFDIAKIKQEGTGSDIGDINNYILKLIKEAPKHLNALPSYIIHNLIKQISANSNIYKAFQYIALSQIGLDSEMLQKLSSNLNMNELSKIAYLLSDFLLEDKVNHRWYFRDYAFGESLWPENPLEYYQKLYQLCAHMREEDEHSQTMLPYYAIKAHASEEESISAYLVPKQANELYSDCISQIIHDKVFANDTIAICKNLSLNKRINLISNLFYALDRYHIGEGLSIFLADNCVLDIPIQEVDGPQSYNMGYLCLRVKSSLKRKETANLLRIDIAHDRNFYLCKAIEYYKKCYSIDPTHRDVRNMLKTALLEDMDRVMNDGDWDAIEEYYKLINEL